MSSSMDDQKYPTAMRVIHWTRAIIMIGVLAVGFFMVAAPDDYPGKYSSLYPNHKQFGVLVLALVLIQLLLKRRGGVPEPAKLEAWEQMLFTVTHKSFYILMIAVPVTGYCMSSTYPESGGVPFFFTSLPELLDKNQALSSSFAAAHSLLAHLLLLLVALHVGGILKHRLFDQGPVRRVLDRML